MKDKLNHHISIMGDSHFWWRIMPFIGTLIWAGLCISNNLWYDEAYSAALITHSFQEVVEITAADAHSPFYYVPLKIVYHLFGGGVDFWPLKMFSLLFMCGYLFLGKYYVKKLFDEKISLYFMFFSITMPIMSVQAGNVRMYAMSLFFMTLMGLSAYDIYKSDLNGQKKPRLKWLIFSISSIATVYCHTFSMIQAFFIYVIFLLLLLCQKNYNKLKGVLISGVVVAVIYFPWLLVTYTQITDRAAGNNTAQVPTIYSFMDYCMEWFSALESPIGIVVFVGMGIAAILLYSGIRWMRCNKNYVAGIGMTVMALTTITGVIVSLYITPCFLGRYIFSGFGALALLYAIGMCRIPYGKLKVVIALAALFCFVIQYRSEWKLEYHKGLEEYHEFYAAQVNENDCFMGPSEHTLMLSVYYPEHHYFLYGHLPERSPFQNTEAFTRWEQLEEETGTIWYICFAQDSPYLLGEYYDYEEAFSFSYMYYDFIIYRLLPKS
ncbi:hypothetical protein LJC58_04205 [Lachnospiraceae bacterium OttesenSCG-928-D06]|nr:hypothetical protein [Lachnospiraceae bacterium OttesenSCG-928-D06]